MQKFSLSQIIREEVIRGLVFAVAFFAFLSVGFVSIAYAANGGRFGAILNTILASGDWENPGDGTVKNSMQLGGIDASNYVVSTAGFSCGAGQCIYGIGADDTPLCQ